ncbi:MAG: hypothetical protein NTZ44_00940 [Candidatus Nomurabacteria bacterium]|nr:hypothetical protein [Candidatus Nomurabacteria bacterium]
MRKNSLVLEELSTKIGGLFKKNSPEKNAERIELIKKLRKECGHKKVIETDIDEIDHRFCTICGTQEYGLGHNELVNSSKRTVSPEKYLEIKEQKEFLLFNE